MKLIAAAAAEAAAAHRSFRLMQSLRNLSRVVYAKSNININNAPPVCMLPHWGSAFGENNHIYYRQNTPGSPSHQRGQHNSSLSSSPSSSSPERNSLNKLSTPQGHMPKNCVAEIKAKTPPKVKGAQGKNIKKSRRYENRENSFRKSLHESKVKDNCQS